MLLEQEQAALVNKLTLHQSRRTQFIPTLSVLIGGSAATRLLWLKWAQQTNRHTAMCTGESLTSVLEAWLSMAAKHYDLQSLGLKSAAELANQSAEQLSHWLSHASEYQIERFWQQLSEQTKQTRWLKWLLEQGRSARKNVREVNGFNLTALEDNSFAAIAQIFTLVSGLIPGDALPGVLVHSPSADDELQTTLPILTRLVETVPAVPMGLLLEAAQADRILDALPESRAKAILRSGIIEVATPETAALKQWLSDRGLENEKHLQSILHVTQQYGATEELLTTALSLSESAEKTQPTADDEGTYRSQAERLLFQYLEARSTTAGKFRANVRLDIRFGNRAMEVDFLADKTKVVIELDGYYHFQSSDSYRRDRRKDIALQQKGFWVLRFLSEDVVANLEEILATIDQALSLRQSSIHAQSPAQLET